MHSLSPGSTEAEKKNGSDSLNRLPNSADVEQVLANIQKDGYCVIKGLATPDLMGKIAKDMDPWIARTCYGKDEAVGTRTRRTGSLIARSPYGRKLIMEPLVLAAARRWLSHASAIQLNNAQILSVGPGAKGQPIHIDEHSWDFQVFDRPIMFNTIWALTEFTEANGATRIVPGSHTLPAGINYQYDETVPVTMDQGDVLLYSGKLYHGAGANTTSDKVRQGITITYVVGWLRQEENHYLGCPPEIARTLPDDLLRLMGYQIGSHGIGWFRDYEDPIAAVRDIPYEQIGYIEAVKRSLQAAGEDQAAVLFSQEQALADERKRENTRS
jgi:ectoine hydroxylase-related dioxygenase (phytanoyl-CoA dioxygenase family)